MKFICIGDSLTTGFGINKEFSWFELLKSSSNFELINKGVNGDTTTGILSRYYKDVIINSPCYLFIMAGTNDFLLNRSLNSVEENLSLIIKEALENNIIPFIGIPPFIDESLAIKQWDSNINYSIVNNKLKSYRSYIITLCKKLNLKYIDLYSLFNDINKKHTGNSLYLDGIHPNKYTHKGIFEKIKKVMF
ncbi:GDSL-type esterase/lipase family protein [Clostridium oceanicum]|uniref:GDSL-type esterase/lipase family protein n=1 Tax=Clostridium oceanicum TaxID=1543 RepID=A0ABP3V4W1_9CLOT